MQQLTITIDDPDTILLLKKYRRFISQEDAVDGTMDQIAEGLILTMLDDNGRFADWVRTQTTVVDATDMRGTLNNVPMNVNIEAEPANTQSASGIVPIAARA
jgi:hypothetical protein